MPALPLPHSTSQLCPKYPRSQGQASPVATPSLSILLFPIRFLKLLGNRLGSTYINSRPTHPQRHHDRQRSRDDAQYKHSLDSRYDCLEHPLLHFWIQCAEKGASGPSDGSLHIRPRDTGEQVRDGVLGEIEKYGICHAKRDGDAGDLRARDETDGQSDFFGRHEPLRNGKGRANKEAHPQPAENERGIYVGGAAGAGDEEEHGVAGDDEEAPGEEPWEVVLEFLHQHAVDH